VNRVGDGVLAYFVYPQAHEEEAEQAVRAGLATSTGATAFSLITPVRTQCPANTPDHAEKSTLAFPRGGARANFPVEQRCLTQILESALL
jgi:hypothetical protein